MTKLKNPLFSLTAQKQLGHELIYKMKGNRAFVTKYNRPGNKNPFSPSASQVTNREFYTSAVAIWQAKTQDQKDYWNELAKEKNLSMSGWNLFIKPLLTVHWTHWATLFLGSVYMVFIKTATSH